jgi:DnaJ family protein C protein 2
MHLYQYTFHIPSPPVVYHPDKSTAAWLQKKEEEAKAAKKTEAKPARIAALGGGVEEEEKEETLDERFTRLTLAYETLTDLKRRRDYDSTYGTIDDAVPKPADVTPENFFEQYVPVFKRNARWSETTPVPQLGGPESSWEEVSEFYEFWFDFKSWRSFPKSDKHKLEDAGERDERRWMEGENKRIRAKLVKEESARLMKLVETAHRLDPRVVKHMAAEKEKKNAKKNARKAAAEAEAKAAEEAAAAAAAAAEAEAEAAKKAKDQAKKDKEQAIDEFKAFQAMGDEDKAKHEAEAKGRIEAALKAKEEAEAKAKAAKK